MCEGYNAPGEDDKAYSELDELLCEYVDGTMDPDVRKVFDEYLRTDPVLAEHVTCLCHTRRLLCRHGCHLRAPRGLQTRLRRRLACEMIQAQKPLLAVFSARLRAFASFVSAMVVMLVVGMFVGAALFSETALPTRHGGARTASEGFAPHLLDDASVGARPEGYVPLYAQPYVSGFGGMTGPLPAASSPLPTSWESLLADTLQRGTPLPSAPVRKTDGAP